MLFVFPRKWNRFCSILLDSACGGDGNNTFRQRSKEVGFQCWQGKTFQFAGSRVVKEIGLRLKPHRRTFDVSCGTRTFSWSEAIRVNFMIKLFASGGSLSPNSFIKQVVNQGMVKDSRGRFAAPFACPRDSHRPRNLRRGSEDGQCGLELIIVQIPSNQLILREEL